jgi:hypothetical protein
MALKLNGSNAAITYSRLIIHYEFCSCYSQESVKDTRLKALPHVYKCTVTYSCFEEWCLLERYAAWLL